MNGSGPGDEGRVRRDAEERRARLWSNQHCAANTELRPCLVDGGQDGLGQQQCTNAESCRTNEKALDRLKNFEPCSYWLMWILMTKTRCKELREQTFHHIRSTLTAKARSCHASLDILIISHHCNTALFSPFSLRNFFDIQHRSILHTLLQFLLLHPTPRTIRRLIPLTSLLPK